jgi:hypothetical protein
LDSPDAYASPLVYWPFSVFHMLHRGGAAEMQSGFVTYARVTL